MLKTATNTITCTVYLLDMMWDGDSFYENNRQGIGIVQVPVTEDGEVTEKALIDTMIKYGFCDIQNRRIVYAEDLYGDGTRYEIGIKRDHVPVFSVEPVER